MKLSLIHTYHDKNIFQELQIESGLAVSCPPPLGFGREEKNLDWTGLEQSITEISG